MKKVDLVFFYGYDVDDNMWYATSIGVNGYLTFGKTEEELMDMIKEAVDNDDLVVEMIESDNIENKVNVFNSAVEEEMFLDLVIRDFSLMFDDEDEEKVLH
jgi:predicted RNase H-like HicB family nuclease